MHTHHALAYLALAGVLVAASACGEAIDSGNENELITSVIVTFTPTAGGDSLVFEADDPDGDGGDPPTIDAIELAPNSYDVAVSFENRLEEPAEDITGEVADEAEEHQIFFTGSAVDGPATDNAGAPLAHSYRDQDDLGLPLGLENQVTAATGSGDLTISLRHLPPLNDVATKTADVAATVRDSGFSAIGGTTDAQVTFPVSVP